MAGLYIHIPFCESRCIYCGFYSTTSLALRSRYVDALCREMEMRPLTVMADGGSSPEPATQDDTRIETIYLGGGTPSLLSEHMLRQLFTTIGRVYRLSEHPIEVTIECNPDDVTETFCQTLRSLPINRVSMGAQTFSDERLRFLHRRHKAENVRLAVNRLRAVGIGNISIDLMFGFPGETLQDWQQDLEEAISLHPEHISAYSLMIEEGTPLHRLVEEGKIREVDEEVSRTMYDMLIDRLCLAGYEHYEISNFALPGFRSRHNSSYWREVPYVGIGAAAHSYEISATTVRRSWNVADIKRYIRSIEEGRLPSEGEELDQKTQYNDLITTALRTREGISLSRLLAHYGKHYYDYLLGEANPHIERHMLTVEDDRLRLTRLGLYVCDDIMSDLIML